VTRAKNIMTLYAVGDPIEKLCNILLEILGKAEEYTDTIFHLWHFLDKTLGRPPWLTWMKNIKK